MEFVEKIASSYMKIVFVDTLEKKGQGQPPIDRTCFFPIT
jgi:hypothetical protein